MKDSDRIRLDDFEPAELTKDVLDDLCKDSLGISLRELMRLSVLLKELQGLLNNSIHPDRMAALIKASNKPDPLDCTYVRKCVIDLLRKEDDFVRFKGLLGMLDGKLG